MLGLKMLQNKVIFFRLQIFENWKNDKILENKQYSSYLRPKINENAIRNNRSSIQLALSFTTA